MENPFGRIKPPDKTSIFRFSDRVSRKDVIKEELKALDLGFELRDNSTTYSRPPNYM